MLSIPSYLLTPPSSTVRTPTETRKQELPFEELTWEDFEKICLRLARLEDDVEHCQLYGERGDDQEGIDLYTRKKLSEKYTVYQCKREKNFGASKIKAAFLKFNEGDWINQTDEFILCTQESLKKRDRADAFKNQSELLKAKGISCIKWDCDELSIKLKEHPEIVDDFFGRSWVAIFCGQDKADGLKNRLDTLDMIQYRSELGRFYNRVFNMNDPGLPATILDVNTSLPLEKRYVLPNIQDRRSISIERENNSIPNIISANRVAYPDLLNKDKPYYSGQELSSPIATSINYPPQPISKWLAKQSHSIILGSPGSGKSTFLRFLAIDILQEVPQLSLLAEKWGGFLPVWVPFAWWTKMIHQTSSSACSLSEMLYAWLKSWDEEKLFSLVEKALSDKRLLLLIDGLDEWANEDAARIALDRLQLFIGQRNIPAIATSRPQGFDKLSVQGGNWEIGELSSFSSDQQKELAKIWFLFRATSSTQNSKNSYEYIQRTAESDAMSFMKELGRSRDITELAKTPLLLCLLIALRMKNTNLPTSRFKAYDQLVVHLISTHPKMRRRAASVTNETPIDLSDDDLKKIMAYLAYKIRGINGTGIIESEQAVHAIEEHLKNPEGDFDFEQNKARIYSRNVLEVGENTIGLLVKQSPTDLGFFHRAFWEYLSSYHLSRLTLSEQKKFLEDFCNDPQSHEVILGLLQISNRPQDVKELVQCLQRKKELVHLADRISVELLLSEVAFGEFNCPPNLSKEIAANVFEEIEFGFWMPQRERLLKNVLDGLRSTSLKETVKSKIKTWFPSHRRYKRNVFQAISSWPPTTETIEILWKGIHDEDFGNKSASAISLAEIAQGNLLIADRLIKLINNPLADSYTCAVAIDSLINGWSSHEAIGEILVIASSSISPELRLIAICGKISKNIHCKEDYEELLLLGSSNSELHYSWKYKVVSALLDGWKNSSEIKLICLERLKANQVNLSPRLDQSIAFQILLSGYPQDVEVANFCVDQIRQKYPFAGSEMDYQAWQLLSENFESHIGLAEAIDEWIVRPEQEYHEVEVAYAALLGKTARAKSVLISSLKSSFSLWSADALIKGWGIDDPDIHHVLENILLGDASSASKIAHLAPLIINDNKKCYLRLMDILYDSKCSRHDLVLSGLNSSKGKQTNSKVVNYLIDLMPNLTERSRHLISQQLFSIEPDDPRIMSIAKQELSKSGGDSIIVRDHYIAQIYKDSEEIRFQISNSLFSLPNYLRRIIASSLSENNYDDDFSLSMLKLYDYEENVEIKTQSSIGYHTLLNKIGEVSKEDIEVVSQNIVNGGIVDGRRQAAFSGLVVLERLDIVIDSKGYDQKPCRIIIDDFSPRINSPLLKLILENWSNIKSAFGLELWARLSRTENPDDLWEQLSLFADEYPTACNELINFLNNNSNNLIGSNTLRFLGRVCPNSRLLLDYCLNALLNPTQDHSRWENILVATELLGENFGGDRNVLERIISNSKNDSLFPFGVILALAEGWHDSKEFNDLFNENFQSKFKSFFDKNNNLHYSEYFALICRKGHSDWVFKAIIEIIDNSNTHNYIRDRSFIIRRLQTDEDLYEMLINYLDGNITNTEKSTIAKLIAKARGISPKLRQWCLNELQNQLQNNSNCVGLDLFSRGLRPLTHSLLDILLSDSTSNTV
jgi:NACHT domain